jgi:N-hydroxyarylamine O-acetyltransferase
LTIELDAYFERIAYTGPHTATLGTLRELVVRHAEAIPFENLDPFLRRPVHLDTASLEAKLVRGGRGGYCFEQNLLLKAVLERIGFNVRGLAARVRWNVAGDRITPRSHMLLLVEVEGAPFVADVGFGGLTLTAPLSLMPDIAQATPHEPFRLMRAGAEFSMEALVRGEWRPLYRFGLQEQFLPDYEVSSWYLCTHPRSHFITGLIAARTEPRLRYALRNDELAVHDLEGGTTRRRLRTAAEIMDVLSTTFRITLPDAPELESAIERLIVASETAPAPELARGETH